MADQVILYTTERAITLDVLAVHGSAEPDRVSKFPGITHEFLDGSLAEQIAGGRREISIDFNTMGALQRRQVVDWWLDPARQLWSTCAQPLDLQVSAAGGGSLTNVLHSYSVCAIDVVGNSIYADVKTTTPQVNDLINLSWTAVTNARSYKIFRKVDGLAGGTWWVLDYTQGTSYTDTKVMDGSTVLAYKDLGGDSDILLPGEVSKISVISTNELEFEWAFETELARMLSLELREASIFTRAAKFPV